MKRATTRKRLCHHCPRSRFLSAIMIGLLVAVSGGHAFACGMGSPSPRPRPPSPGRHTRPMTHSPDNQRVADRMSNLQQIDGSRGLTIGAPSEETVKRLEKERLLRQEEYQTRIATSNRRWGSFFRVGEVTSTAVKYTCTGVLVVLSSGLAPAHALIFGVTSGGVAAFSEGASEKYAEGASTAEMLEHGAKRGAVSAMTNAVGGKLGQGTGELAGTLIGIGTAAADDALGSVVKTSPSGGPSSSGTTGSNGMPNGHHSSSPLGTTTTSGGHVVYY